MNPIEELVTEHEAVQLTLQILDRMQSDTAHTEKIATPDDLAQLLEFFTVFVDLCHHSKEEELLFPALEAVGVSRAGGPIGVLLDEHAQGRVHVAQMKRALSNYEDGHAHALEALREHATAYIDLLKHHIEKENQVLFPLAASQLSPGTMSELKIGFDRIEETKIGAGRHEAFHRLLDRLKAVYLGDDRD
jgi:hemerythrin-like domain-containing protein